MYVELYYSFFVVDCMSILCTVMGIGYLKIGFLGTQINLQTVVVVPWIFQIMENPFFGYYVHLTPSLYLCACLYTYI